MRRVTMLLVFVAVGLLPLGCGESEPTAVPPQAPEAQQPEPLPASTAEETHESAAPALDAVTGAPAELSKELPRADGDVSPEEGEAAARPFCLANCPKVIYDPNRKVCNAECRLRKGHSGQHECLKFHKW
jgi:hypothetical protein